MYYARAVYGAMLTSLSVIVSEQSAPTKRTMKKYKQLLDYPLTKHGAILTYRARNMVLVIHSNASYLNEPKARSLVGGHHFILSNSNFMPNNGAVLNISQIIKTVMSLAAKSKLGSLLTHRHTCVLFSRTAGGVAASIVPSK